MKLTPVFALAKHMQMRIWIHWNLGLVPNGGEEDHLPMVTLRNKAHRKSTSFVGQDLDKTILRRLEPAQPYHDVNVDLNGALF
jgi:hypothetical protein